MGVQLVQGYRYANVLGKKHSRIGLGLLGLGLILGLLFEAASSDSCAGSLFFSTTDMAALCVKTAV